MWNLRVATDAENNRNRRSPSRKTDAPQGSLLNPKTGRYQVNIEVGGKSIYLGAYRDPALLNEPTVRRLKITSASLRSRGGLSQGGPQHEPPHCRASSGHRHASASSTDRARSAMREFSWDRICTRGRVS